jgi:hypothetical protein
MKRQRERQKAEKAAKKRELRLHRGEQDSSTPPAIGENGANATPDAGVEL